MDNQYWTINRGDPFSKEDSLFPDDRELYEAKKELTKKKQELLSAQDERDAANLEVKQYEDQLRLSRQETIELNRRAAHNRRTMEELVKANSELKEKIKSETERADLNEEALRGAGRNHASLQKRLDKMQAKLKEIEKELRKKKKELVELNNNYLQQMVLSRSREV